MLVLRRRSGEVIVFEGGLTVTLVELADHKAWLGFDAPSIEQTIVLSPLEVSNDTMSLGIKSPLALRRDGDITHVDLEERAPQLASGQGGPPATLVLNVKAGDQVSFDGMSLRVGSVQNERGGFEIDVPCLGRTVTISVQSVSGIEARIGIEAPDDLRVMRKELWLDLVDANQSAAQWSTDDMDSLRAPSDRAPSDPAPSDRAPDELLHESID